MVVIGKNSGFDVVGSNGGGFYFRFGFGRMSMVEYGFVCSTSVFLLIKDFQSVHITFLSMN